MDNKNSNNQKSTKICKVFKKGLQIGMLATMLGTGFSCKLPPYAGVQKPGSSQTELQTKPCDIVLGNGNYIAHQFIGDEIVTPPSSTYSPAKAFNAYIIEGEKYVKNKINDFEKSLKDSPAALAYFSEYIKKLKNNKFVLYG